MDKTEFLKKNIFLNLENLNADFETEERFYFSEADFEIVLERIEQFGIGIYRIEPRFEGGSLAAKTNEDYRKKATDPKWYKRAFFELKKQQANMQYSATYRVSERLLKR
jgi:hypothetical protein